MPCDQIERHSAGFGPHTNYSLENFNLWTNGPSENPDPDWGKKSKVTRDDGDDYENCPDKENATNLAAATDNND